jgi:hypothetical protein
VVKAERDATAAHHALADGRAAADAAVAAKQREVAARLAALDASADHWPAPVRAKVEVWQERVGQLEARVAALQVRDKEREGERERAKVEVWQERVEARVAALQVERQRERERETERERDTVEVWQECVGQLEARVAALQVRDKEIER